MKSRRRNLGFTLIEIMLVLLIIGGLAALAVFTMGGTGEKANKQMTDARIKKIMTSLQRYSLDMKDYSFPTDEQGLRALITPPDLGDEKKNALWGGPYMAVDELNDFWGEELKYELVEDSTTDKPVPHISSAGPDKEHGTDDDIKSWSEEEGA